MEQYKKNSLTLIGAVAMGTGVMIGAGNEQVVLGGRQEGRPQFF